MSFDEDEVRHFSNRFKYWIGFCDGATAILMGFALWALVAYWIG